MRVARAHQQAGADDDTELLDHDPVSFEYWPPSISSVRTAASFACRGGLSVQLGTARTCPYCAPSSAGRPLLALSGHRSMLPRSLLLRVERTCLDVPAMSPFDPTRASASRQ